MAHRGARSIEAKRRRTQRRKAKDIMLQYAFNDRMNGDVVNLLRSEQVLDYLSRYLVGEPVLVDAVPCAAEPGYVLSDPYGRGVFQR